MQLTRYLIITLNTRAMLPAKPTKQYIRYTLLMSGINCVLFPKINVHFCTKKEDFIENDYIYLCAY